MRAGAHPPDRLTETFGLGSSLAAINRPVGRREARAEKADDFSAFMPVSVFLACLVWRAPTLLLAPRFWAEELGLYYAQLQDMGPADGLLKVVNGNYQLLTNAIVELSLQVQPRHAAYVTTYAALVVATGCAMLIARFLICRGCSLWIASAACAMFALQPAGYEVFLSATNVQWVSSVLALFLVLSNDVPATSRQAILRYGLLLVCGLTGTTSCILLPVLLIVALRRRTSFCWMMTGVLAGASVVQGIVVFAHRDELHRPFAIARHMLLPLVFQVFYAQILPIDAVSAWSALAGSYGRLGTAIGVQLVVLGLFGMAAITALAVRRTGLFTAALLMSAALSVSLVNEFGALDHADRMISGWIGARYFFFGASCLLVLIAAGAKATRTGGAIFGLVLVALVLLNMTTTAAFAKWTAMFLEGPSVAEQIDACGAAPRCPVTPWPPGRFQAEIGTRR